MSRYSRETPCTACGTRFRYFLLDTVSNAAAFAYCETCGTTALCSRDAWPSEHAHVLNAGAPVPDAVATALSACSCGGRFAGNAAPRCPTCGCEISASEATSWLEKNSRVADFRWPGTWQGVYCIVIENRLESDPWQR